MVFSSLTFLCGFLPLVLLLYFICPNRSYRNGVLLVCSLLFYAWGEPRLLPLMLLASLVAYFGGLLMQRFSESGHTGARRAAFLTTVCLLLANLLIFKYLNFFGDNLQAIGLNVRIPYISLPIGISFYTFQILSYVIDLNRGKIPVQKNWFLLTLYVCFFPQLIAGPIVRYETIAAEITERRENWDDVVSGFKRFILGLAKKVILANNVALLAKTIYAGDPAIYGTAAYWIAAIAYTFQIYFDFSGYSDMAIGLGRIFGFHFLENFDYPYLSRSITEFWHRWHISLSSWFRDYVYIPLGGNRVSRAKWVLNILIVWALTGFWHGAQWNFLCWGLYYAALLLLEKWLGKYLEKLPGLIRWLYAFLLINIGWVIFNRTDTSQMLLALRSMFSYHPTDWLGAVAADSSILIGVCYLLPSFVFSFPLLRHLKMKEGIVRTILSDGVYLGLLILCLVMIISSSFNPFIYFRF